jgi:hypothetical protein
MVVATFTRKSRGTVPLKEITCRLCQSSLLRPLIRRGKPARSTTPSFSCRTPESAAAQYGSRYKVNVYDSMGFLWVA